MFSLKKLLLNLNLEMVCGNNDVFDKSFTLGCEIEESQAYERTRVHGSW